MTDLDVLDYASLRPTPEEFAWIAAFLARRTGVELKPGKEAMVAGRLSRRLRQHGMTSYAEYLKLLKSGDEVEARHATDLLTTNETYFFREPQHFELLDAVMRQRRPGAPPVRVWSAACSSGEEAYTIAMTLAEALPSGTWEVLGTDISTRVLERARAGVYPIEAAARVPPSLLRKYCLRGRDEYEGYFAVGSQLRERVGFLHANLLHELGQFGDFDVVFLRNVMIYFAQETKQALVQRIEQMIRPGGLLIVSHSESLKDLGRALEMVKPSVYRRAT